ncbi:hypothetical protein [Streptomyces sp. NBC_01760]|uniref:hypothetical protein n=1 Tax=Streptomyces sp. NBC_01760 TaxID=2975931 RepID=UPI002DDAC175|nr:hypothetical protein [Streptomyces sp. NBC_01760]WSC72099.1 hypothetical protein OG807_28525 [Streptomyces sp. NBC_01760]
MGQKIAWSLLVVCSLGLLQWVPFLVVAIKRGLRRDWIAFGAFAFVAVVTAIWGGLTANGDDDQSLLGFLDIGAMGTAVVLVWVWLFNKPAVKADAVQPSAPSGRDFLT